MMRAVLLIAAIAVLAGSAAGSYAIVTAEPAFDRIEEPAGVRVDQPRSQRPLSIDVTAR